MPTESLFEVLWSFSDPLVEEILRSSTFLGELRSGRLTQSCYDRFVQQEALYLQRVGGMLEVRGQRSRLSERAFAATRADASSPFAKCSSYCVHPPASTHLLL